MSPARKRILLVEDEALLAITETMQLEKYGYAVRTVTNGEKAVEAVKTSHDIDLILMDINLGSGIDGTEAAGIILKDHDIPVVFLSSHTDPEVVEKTEKITSYGYVVKNSNIAVLDASIKMAFKLFEAKVGIKHHQNMLGDINRIGRLANSTLELDTVLRFILEETVRALGTTAGMIFLNNPDTGTLTWGASVGLSQAFVDEFSVKPIRMGEGLTGRIAETGKPIFVSEDSSHDARVARAVVHREELQSFIGVPIFADNRVVGVMNILTRRPSRLTEDNVDFCSAIGVQVGSAIHNARIYARQTQVTEELLEARKKIMESEERFRALFEKGPIGVAYHEMMYDESGKAVDYRFLDANTSYRELTGVDPRGKRATEAFPGIESDPFDWIGTFGRVATTGEQIRFEQYLQPNDRWYDCVGYQVKPDHFVAAFVEITQRKHAEKAMKEQRNFAEGLIEAARTIILVLDVNGSIVRFNPYTETLLGVSLNELKGKNWFETFVEPEECPTLDMLLQNAIHEGEASDHVNTIAGKHGRRILVQWSNTPLRDAEGNIVGVLAVGEDITEREQQRHHLTQEQHRLAAIISGTDAGTWEWNVQTGETRFNEKWASIIGYTLGEISPASIETWHRFTHPDDYRRSEALLEMHFNGETERYEIETRMRHKDGRWVWVLDRGKVATWTADGKPEWVFGTHQDITERKQTEKELHITSNLQSIILRMASDYINQPLENVDERINRSLQEIGEFVEADRAYVFEYDWVQEVANNTHEWCSEGVSPEIDHLQGVPNTLIDYWVEAHRNGREVSIEDVTQLPIDDGVRRVLEPQGVKSVLSLPMMRQSQCVGFVGFDSVREIRTYSEIEKTLLTMFSEMLVNIGYRTESSSRSF